MTTRRNRIALLTLVFCLGLSLTWALPAATTEYAATASFLDIGLGARAMGMGGAFVAMSGDAACIYYNPAGLAAVRGVQATSLYSTEYGLSNYSALGVALPNIGLATVRLGSLGIARTDELGNVVGEFDVSSSAVLAGMSQRIGALAVGASAVYATESLHSATGKGITGSIGGLLDLHVLRLGAAIHHAFGAMDYDGVQFPFQPRSVVGVGLSLSRLKLNGEYESSKGDEPRVRCGAEAQLSSILAVRAGAAMGLNTRQMDLSAGLGVKLGAMQVDYAYLVAANLPATHRLSLGLSF